MKQLFFITTVLLCMLIIPAAFGQISDSSNHTTLLGQKDSMVIISQPVTDAMADDFAPALFMMAVGAAACIFMFIGAGIVLTVVGILILFGLISFGILSASVMVGLHQKSFAKGFKTFVILASTLIGMLACIGAMLLLNQIVHWCSLQTAVLLGVCSGLVAGIIFGFVANRLAQRLSNYFKQKLDLLNDTDSLHTV